MLEHNEDKECNVGPSGDVAGLDLEKRVYTVPANLPELLVQARADYAQWTDRSKPFTSEAFTKIREAFEPAVYNTKKTSLLADRLFALDSCIKNFLAGDDDWQGLEGRIKTALFFKQKHAKEDRVDLSEPQSTFYNHRKNGKPHKGLSRTRRKKPARWEANKQRPDDILVDPEDSHVATDEGGTPYVPSRYSEPSAEVNVMFAELLASVTATPQERMIATMLSEHYADADICKRLGIKRTTLYCAKERMKKRINELKETDND